MQWLNPSEISTDFFKSWKSKLFGEIAEKLASYCRSLVFESPLISDYWKLASIYVAPWADYWFCLN